MSLYHLKEVLKRSVEKNGEKPLTNAWLLNIIKMAERDEERDDHRSELEGCRHEIY